jgi:hypothetical protein
MKWAGLPLALILAVGYLLSRGYHMELHWLFSIHFVIAGSVYGTMIYFIRTDDEA